jgi:hypothetical protein
MGWGPKHRGMGTVVFSSPNQLFSFFSFLSFFHYFQYFHHHLHSFILFILIGQRYSTAGAPAGDQGPGSPVLFNDGAPPYTKWPPDAWCQSSCVRPCTEMAGGLARYRVVGPTLRSGCRRWGRERGKLVFRPHDSKLIRFRRDLREWTHMAVTQLQ